MIWGGHLHLSTWTKHGFEGLIIYGDGIYCIYYHSGWWLISKANFEALLSYHEADSYHKSDV